MRLHRGAFACGHASMGTGFLGCVSSIGGGFDGRAGCVGDDAQRFGRFVRALHVAMKHVDAGPPGGILHLRSMLSEGESPSCASSFVQRHAPPAGDMESQKADMTS